MKATIPSYHQIKRGLQIYEEIERLQNELAQLFGVKSADQVSALLSSARSDAPVKRRGRPPRAIATGKRGRKKAEQTPQTSPNGGDAAVKRRGRKAGSAATAKKAKRIISQAHRDAIAAAQKKRWAAAKGQ